MNNDEYIFSWAEDEYGRMVYVDDVPRGEKCGCVCPCCHERLVARHGDVRRHSFAHDSATYNELAQNKDKRGANLEMCYPVSVYKLAEQIVQTRKCICVPPYYGCFKSRDIIKFKTVEIDSRYEREDKQPDITAIAEDGKQYLIEFIFSYKVQHKQKIDYENLNCLQIDLANQSLDYKKLEEFLLKKKEERQWINNQDYFNEIEAICQKRVKDPIKLVKEVDCVKCIIKSRCVAAKDKNTQETIEIENNGIKYKLCQEKLFKEQIAQFEKRKKDERRIEIVNESEKYRTAALYRKNREAEMVSVTADSSTVNSVPESLENSRVIKLYRDDPNRSCLNCVANLPLKCKGEMAYCGSYLGGYSQKGRVNPSFAKTCDYFKKI